MHVPGGPSGGASHVLHTDQWCNKHKAANPSAKCAGLPEPVFFLDFQDPRVTCSPESPALAAPPAAAAAADAEEQAEVTTTATTVARHMDSIDGDDHCGRLKKNRRGEGEGDGGASCGAPLCVAIASQMYGSPGGGGGRGGRGGGGGGGRGGAQHPEGEDWTCGACTMNNTSADQDSCNICGTPRPPPVAAAAAGAGAAQENAAGGGGGGGVGGGDEEDDELAAVLRMSEEAHSKEKEQQKSIDAVRDQVRGGERERERERDKERQRESKRACTIERE